MKRVLLISVLMASISAAKADLAAYWNFEDGSGLTAADVSGNGAQASLIAADGISYPQWTAGQIGSGALLFNTNAAIDPNERNYLLVDPNDAQSDPNVLDLGDAFTISMWVRRDYVSGTDWGYLVYTDAYDLELAQNPEGTGDNSNDYFWSDSTTAWRTILGTQTDAQQTGNWYHLAVTYDKLVLRKYINGVLQYTSRHMAPNVPKASSGLYIATRGGVSGSFTGALDDVAIWAGSYLPTAEVAKLANQTATPLTVSQALPLPDNYFTKETNLAWTSSGWKLLVSPSFSTGGWEAESIALHANNTATIWWAKDIELPGWPNASMMAGGHYAIFPSDPAFFKFRDITPENYYDSPARDVNRYGIAWIDQSWNGRGAQTAVFAPYITPDIALCLPNSAGYQEYNPAFSWTLKDYFKTYARVAAVNGAGASLLVKSYSYVDGSEPRDPNNLTYLGEVRLPLLTQDYVWKELKFAYPKPYPGSSLRVWTEVSIAGGNENTRVYIDEFNPVSDQANTSQHAATYKGGDFDKDTSVNIDDLWQMADGWLDSSAGMLEPRSGGLLSNADFYADMDRLAAADDAHWAVDPIGWTFSGDGDYGIWRVAKRGQMNYTGSALVVTPLGGSIAAYMTDMYENDPYGVLEQTASQTAVNGQTYYAMGYVLGTHLTNSWYSWKDTATMEIAVDGVVKATFTRKLSRNIWRPIYGTYTATAADAGKSIAIRFSYANTHTAEAPEPGNMYVGYAYLGTTIPVEWPEGRDNLLTNGGFEDLSALEAAYPSIAQSIRNSDNWGGWFPSLSLTPPPPGWLYEVPSGFDDPNEGGIWASGIYATPLPSPGMSDICIYTSDDLILGQVVGALQNGTTYYLDMACGVNSGDYGTIPWPSPAPTFHLELWRIPAGVTDATTIYNAIAGGNPNYVKIAEAVADATGNISGGSGIPVAKWQLIGTAYIATAADTNVYVRVYGAGGAASLPEYAFSDAYLSTEKRLVPGGDITFDITSGMAYDTLGPYNCYHGVLMGVGSPEEDLDGNCIVNIRDLAVLAGNWVENWYNNITGVAPWE